MNCLICPLNWGLGHATRCIPIIRQLLTQGASVWIAASGRAGELLKREFPHLSHLSLPDYRLHYPSAGGNFLRTMLVQLPKLWFNVAVEHRQVQRWVKQFNIELIISDNCYGCWSRQCYNVFVCHHLFIQLPTSLRRFEPLLWRIHRRFIGRFDECWIPDVADNNQNLSGDLSHPTVQQLPTSVRYIGALSRLQRLENVSPRYELLVLLSGVEPQRTLFEQE